jgi:hypothetical protein
MKLRNKKTGEIIIPTDYTFSTYDDGIRYGHHIYYSLAELNDEWEDYEEPKDIWWLDNEGRVNHASGDFSDSFRKNREIGNYFLSREEAEKAVEKLKAWKRLKDKGFRFDGAEVFREGLLEIDGVLPALKGADSAERLKIIDDLRLLFGKEEECES